MAETVSVLMDTLTSQAEDVPVPSCLIQYRNSELFYCKICSEPFTNIHRLISHGSECRGAGAGDKSVRCPYCGQSFSSAVALSLHQMVWSRDRGSDSQDDTSTNGSPGNAAVGDLKCPLHCTNNHFTLDNLKSHLLSFHGCDKSSVSTHKTRSGQVSVSVDVGDSGVDCPRCGTRIIPGPNLSLESHVVMDCFYRSDRVTRVVSRLVKDARKEDLDPLLVIKMEMESVLDRNLDLPMDDNEADSKFCFLPDNFTQKYLNVKKRSIGSDIFEMFYNWSEYIEKSSGAEDLIDLIEKFEDEIKYIIRSSQESQDPSETDRATTPDPMILSQIESEMETMSRLSPSNRDMEMILNQMGLSVK